MRKYILLGFTVFLFLLNLNARNLPSKGWVRDNVTEQGLIRDYGNGKAASRNNHTGTVTDADGHFYIKGMAAGRYQLEFSYRVIRP